MTSTMNFLNTLCLIPLLCVVSSPYGIVLIEGFTGGSASPATGSRTNSLVPHVEGGCPENYYGSPGTTWCYNVEGLLPSTMKTFEYANKACEVLLPGSRLASVHSDTDQKMLMTLIAGLKTRIWIGLHRGQVGFAWVDNTTISYSKYGRDQVPSDKHNCVAMQTKIDVAGDWEYTDCQEKLSYVCEYAKDPNLPQRPPYFKCGKDYLSFRSSCYRLFSKAASWLSGELKCKSQGAHLLSIEDRYEEAFMEILFDLGNQTQIWIGLSDIPSPGTFVWADGWPVLYTDWGSDQPDLFQSCVAHDRGSAWSTKACSSSLPFVCEFNRDSSLYPINKPTVPGKCPSDDWVHLEEHCYLVTSKSLKPWSEADAFCQGVGGHLASMHSEKENYFLFRIINGKEKENVWIGLKRTGSRSFKWSDKSEEEYFAWDSNSHREQGDTACTLAQGTDGKWKTADCLSRHGFVCKTKQISPSTPSTSTLTSGSPTNISTTTTANVTKSHTAVSTDDPVTVTATSSKITIPYTTPPTNSSHEAVRTDSKPDKVVIAVSVVGVLFSLTVIAFFVYFLVRRKRLAREQEAMDNYMNTAMSSHLGNSHLYEDANADCSSHEWSGRYSIYG